MSVILDPNSTRCAIKPLDNENYFNWSFRMETILRHKGLWKVMNSQRPSVPAEAATWDAADQEALTLMRLAVGDDQIKHIRGVGTANCLEGSA